MKNLKAKKEGENAFDDDCYFLGFVVDPIPNYNNDQLPGTLQSQQLSKVNRTNTGAFVCQEQPKKREIRIQNKQVALYIFDIFAWTSLSFLRCNTSLLEEYWKNAANQDDLETINQTLVSKGLSDEENLEALKETALFQPSRRCYGSETETYEGGFEEVIPVRQEHLEGSSVEEILMQHRSFMNAGKLMVTTVVLGSVVVDTALEYVVRPWSE
ncbi:nucleoporin, Nup133/Nup155-like protein [Artemisia annua]|uniref:Nucleoporin, Nup133/Nup155-like protein n=1 Tax=Artemisia annua TaxID=35608 RepID=A0A2U1NUF3_ARTAN|nr:nucleoporin, Nup133/Nup155-like protein [Artemisia annua]